MPFLKAMSIRHICLAAAALLLIFIAAAKGRIRQTLPSSPCIGCGPFSGLVTTLALIISTDFSEYSVMFHYMLFANDLRTLDLVADMFINTMPEGFFMDIAARTADLFDTLSLIPSRFRLFLTIKSRKKAAQILAGLHLKPEIFYTIL